MGDEDTAMSSWVAVGRVVGHGLGALSLAKEPLLQLNPFQKLGFEPRRCSAVFPPEVYRLDLELLPDVRNRRGIEVTRGSPFSPEGS